MERKILRYYKGFI